MEQMIPWEDWDCDEHLPKSQQCEDFFGLQRYQLGKADRESEVVSILPREASVLCGEVIVWVCEGHVAWA